MNRFFAVFLAVFLLSSANASAAGLDSFLAGVNVQARSDMQNFSARISAQFGVPLQRVQEVVRTVPEPADAFMIFQLGQMSRRPPEQVLSVYNTSGKKGWGAMAKELGIKPGSREFHALKNGDLHFTGQPAPAGGPGKGKGKGHGRGHNK